MIRLHNLSPEDLFVLSTQCPQRLRSRRPSKYLIDDEGIKQFLAIAARRWGPTFT